MALFAAQREQQVAGFAVHREIARLGIGFEFRIELGLMSLVLLLDALAFGFEIRAVQLLRDFGQQRLGQAHHELAQLFALSGGQA
jgi:hypothetical protein